MGNVLLRFDKDYFLDAVGVQGADRKLLMNNVYLSLEWARMDRGSMTEAEAAESMCRRLPQRLHEAAHLLVDRWDRPILPIAGMEQLVSDLKKAGYGVYLLSNASCRQADQALRGDLRYSVQDVPSCSPGMSVYRRFRPEHRRRGTHRHAGHRLPRRRRRAAPGDAGFRRAGSVNMKERLREISRSRFRSSMLCNRIRPLALPLGELSPQVTERALHPGFPSPSSLYFAQTPLP